MHEYDQTPPFETDGAMDPIDELLGRPIRATAIAEPPADTERHKDDHPAPHMPPPVLEARDPREYVRPDALPHAERAKLRGVCTDPAMRTLTKYVLVLDDYEHTAGLLSEFLAEHAMSTVGVNIQPLDGSDRTRWQRAFDAVWAYGPITPVLRRLRRLRRGATSKVIEHWLHRSRNPVRPATAARHYAVKTDAFEDVNDPAFIQALKSRGVELLVCIGCHQVFSQHLRDALPHGAINVHQGLLPHYRGLAPVLHTLADRQRLTGVTVHYATEHLNDGPILAERTRAVRPKDSVADVLRRQQPLAAEALLQAVHKIERGTMTLAPNPDPGRAAAYAPQRRDVRRLREAGRRPG